MIAHERKEDRWAATLRDGTAFSAVAPSQRPVCDAHQSKYSETVFRSCPPARILGRLTSSLLISSARTSAFCLPDPHCPAVWPPYHIPPRKTPVSFDDLWMHNSCRSDDRRAGTTRATLRSGFHGPLPVLYRFGGAIMTIASLKWSQKATATREVLASNDVRTLIANQLG